MTKTNQLNKEKTYYEILEVPSTASQLEIKKAYRRLALIHHPDRSAAAATAAADDNDDNGNNNSKAKQQESATETFQLIGEAYHCLSDPVRRREYDDKLKWSSSSYSSSRPTTRNWSTTSTTSPFFRTTNFRPSSTTRGVRPQQQSTPTSPWHYSYPHRHMHMHMGDDIDTADDHDFFSFFDAFDQFDNLFHHDPFFEQGFHDIDEEFAKRFYNNNNKNTTITTVSTTTTTNNNNYNNNIDTATTSRTSKKSHSNLDEQPVQVSTSDDTDPTSTTGWIPSWIANIVQPEKETTTTTTTNSNYTNEGWIPWLIRQCCGGSIDFQMTTYTSNGRGGVTATSYSSSSSANHKKTMSKLQKQRQRGQLVHPDINRHRIVHNQRRRSHGRSRDRNRVVSSSSYTQMSSSSFIDRQGRQVLVQSKEVDGNRIEDTRIDNVLVQRKVNGVVVDI